MNLASEAFVKANPVVDVADKPDLVVGLWYFFSGKGGLLNDGIEREFLGRQEVGMRDGSVSFLIVRREDGRQHLILEDMVTMIVLA